MRMRRFYASGQCSAIAALLPFSLSLSLFAQTLQTWKSVDGHSFQGALLRMEDRNVVLEGTDGREVTVPLAALDPSSRELAAREHKLALLHGPVFQHRNRNLRFSVYPRNEWLKLEFLKAGVPIENQSYTLSPYVVQFFPGKPHKFFRFAELVEPVKRERDELQMHIKMQNGVVIRFRVKVNEDADLEFRYDLDDVPEGTSADLIAMGVDFKMPSLLEYDIKSESYKGSLSSDGVSYKDLPSLLKDYVIRLDLFDRTSLVIPYHEQREHSIRVRKVTISRDGQPELLLTGPRKSEDGGLVALFYGGSMPVEGYPIRFYAEKGFDKGGPFTIGLK